jgi:FkbM family methyltransferase
MDIVPVGKLTIHHVGGRDGNVSFLAPSSFNRDLLHVIFEADANAIAAIHAARQNHDSQSIIVHACLAENAGTACFHITLVPHGSSLLEPPQQLDSYQNQRGIDYDAKTLEIVERRQVETVSLDEAVAGDNDHPRLPPPDFLSLDTQGTEHDILRGAGRCLSSACGVITETLFAKAYQGQKRFQDIYDLLDREGFAFVRWEHLYESNGPRAPIGLRGSGCLNFGDALFLRRPWTIDAQAKTHLKKLCFFSVVYGHLEYAVSCLDRLTADDLASPQSAYEVFVSELHAAYVRSSRITPPSIGQVLRADRLRAFSEAGFERWPNIFDLSAFTEPSYLTELQNLQRPEDSEVEGVLRRHGFDLLAEKVKSNRREQAYHVEKLIADSMQTPRHG